MWAGLMACCSSSPLCDVVLSLGPCISVAAAFHEVIFVGGLFLAGLTALGVFFCVHVASGVAVLWTAVFCGWLYLVVVRGCGGGVYPRPLELL